MHKSNDEFCCDAVMAVLSEAVGIFQFCYNLRLWLCMYSAVGQNILMQCIMVHKTAAPKDNCLNAQNEQRVLRLQNFDDAIGCLTTVHSSLSEAF